MGWPYLITGSPRERSEGRTCDPPEHLPEAHSGSNITSRLSTSGSTARNPRASDYTADVSFCHNGPLPFFPRRVAFRPIKFPNIAENGEKSRPDFQPPPETGTGNRQPVRVSGSSPLKKAYVRGRQLRNVSASARGWVICTPFSPMNPGSVRIRGRKKIPCRARDSTVAAHDLPMD